MYHSGTSLLACICQRELGADFYVYIRLERGEKKKVADMVAPSQAPLIFNAGNAATNSLQERGAEERYSQR